MSLLVIAVTRAAYLQSLRHYNLTEEQANEMGIDYLQKASQLNPGKFTHYVLHGTWFKNHVVLNEQRPVLVQLKEKGVKEVTLRRYINDWRMI